MFAVSALRTPSAVRRSRSDRPGAESSLAQVRQAVWSVNASLPVAWVRSMRLALGVQWGELHTMIR